MGDKKDFFEREGEKLKIRDETFLFADPQPWQINFTNDQSEDVGKLTFDPQGNLAFEGKTDESAEVFFRCVVRANNQTLEDMRELLKMGLAVVEDFMPNVAQCVLQDYGRLNDFLIKAKAELDD